MQKFISQTTEQANNELYQQILHSLATGGASKLDGLNESISAVGEVTPGMIEDTATISITMNSDEYSVRVDGSGSNIYHNKDSDFAIGVIDYTGLRKVEDYYKAIYTAIMRYNG